MSKRRPIGICRVCGKTAKLTFEHVPPGATYNKQAVKNIKLMDMIEAEKAEGVYPWDTEHVKGHISQRGRGGYYLCEKCNNDTGHWYGHFYKHFVNALMYVVTQSKDSDYKSTIIEMTDVYPLPVYKQIMTMFCDINPGLTQNDPQLRKFILDKNDNEIDTKKYCICMHLLKGGIEKNIGLSALVTIGGGEPLLISEVSAVPVGYILYLDPPNEFKSMGADISGFTKFNYDDKCTLKLQLNIFENNTWIPADFRSKHEIIATVENNKQYQKIVDDIMKINR